MIPEGHEVSRLVIVRPRGLGDVVLSSAVIDALSRRYPEAEIGYLSEKLARPFLESDGRLSRIFLLGQPKETGSRVRIGGTLAALAWMRERPLGLVIDLFCNPKTAFLTGFSGARYRVGLDKRARRVAYNVRVPRFRGDPRSDHRYAREVQLDFLRGAGIRWDGEARANVALLESDREFASKSLAELGYPPGAAFGAVLPGGSWEEKRWTVEGFAAAGALLAERLGSPALVVWGPPEREEAESIVRSLGPRGRLAPPATLRQMAALLATPSLLVSPDCLGRHLAIVQGVPTVGIFGPTDPRDWTPPEGVHGFVRTPSAKTPARDLGPELVLEEIERILRRVDSSKLGL
jgi:ADP-heptose:LPS heptosyltransferase